MKSGDLWRKIPQFPFSSKTRMLNGGYNSTLDEKGRFTFPTRLRESIAHTTKEEDISACEELVVTRGIDRCLWAYPPDKWHTFAAKLENASAMKQDVRLLQRHFLGWAVVCEFDRGGRLAIPQALREWANLKRECVVMGLGERIEIWDADTYRNYSGDTDESDKVIAAAESLACFF
ncbi:MAG: division/cell wall cluster transcriptional repressor MraZ [Spirochaetaceae bacterium]|nr:division/cell wall cluster transcriptional repressor MraZ [Spirochaetaceae bacterium]